MKLSLARYCVGMSLPVLVWSAVAVTSVASQQYHVSIPTHADRADRDLAYACSFEEDMFRCIFDTNLERPDGTDVDLELVFDCVWDYEVGIDIQNSDCSCSAAVDPGSFRPPCFCNTCGGDGVDGLGVGIDCSQSPNQFVDDNCKTVDCNGQCNGIEGLPWLTTRFPSVSPPPTVPPTVSPSVVPSSFPTKATPAPTKAPTKAPTDRPTNAPTVPAPTPPTPPTESPTRRPTVAPTVSPSAVPSSSVAPTASPSEGSAAPSNSPLEDAVLFIASLTNFTRETIYDALGNERITEENVFNAAERLQSGETTPEAFEQEASATNQISLQFGISRDEVAEEELTTEQLVELADAIQVIVGQTNTTGDELSSALDDNILSFDQIINFAGALQAGTAEPVALENYVLAVRSIETTNTEFGRLKRREILDRWTIEQLAGFGKGLVVIPPATNVTEPELITALVGGVVLIEKFNEIADGIIAGTFEVGKLESFITSVEEIESAGLDINAIRERLSRDGNFTGTRVIELANAIITIERETNVDGEDLVESIVSGFLDDTLVVGLAADVENDNLDPQDLELLIDTLADFGFGEGGGEVDSSILDTFQDFFIEDVDDNIPETTVAERFAKDLSLIVERTTLDGSEILDSIELEIITRDEYDDLMDDLESRRIRGYMFELVIFGVVDYDDWPVVQACIETIVRNSDLAARDIADGLSEDDFDQETLCDIAASVEDGGDDFDCIDFAGGLVCAANNN